MKSSIEKNLQQIYNDTEEIHLSDPNKKNAGLAAQILLMENAKKMPSQNHAIKVVYIREWNPNEFSS